jgi:hypothetical protein
LIYSFAAGVEEKTAGDSEEGVARVSRRADGFSFREGWITLVAPVRDRYSIPLRCSILEADASWPTSVW